MDQWIIQGIGIIALIFLVISLQKDKRKFTLMVQFISTCLFSIHFFLLNAFTGSAMNLIAALRAFIFVERDRIKWLNKKWVMYTFIVIFWMAGIFTWTAWFSILPVIAMTFECFSLWEKSTKKLRRLLLVARPFWITYNIIVGSWAGLLTEVFFVFSILIAMFRFDFKKKKAKLIYPDF